MENAYRRGFSLSAHRGRLLRPAKVGVVTKRTEKVIIDYPAGKIFSGCPAP